MATISALITLATLDNPRPAQGIIPLPTLPPLGVTLIVDTTADTEVFDGKCSLREAINATNINGVDDTCDASLSQPGGTDFISFNIGAGNPVINILTLLPTITDKVTIDGSGGAPRVELHGPGYGSGLYLSGADAAGGTITHMVVNNFRDGIYIRADNVTVKGSYIGTNAAGAAAVPNTDQGVDVAGATNAHIGGTNGVTPGGACTGDCNLISGNSANGVFALGGSSIIQGNLIGTNAAGTAAIPNTVSGVHVRAGDDPSLIGGTVDGAANVISGNGAHGIFIGETSSVSVLKNFIGTRGDGETALPNGAHGVLIASAGTPASVAVGSSNAGQANVIAYNGAHGVFVEGSLASGVIRGNSIFSNAGKGIENNLGGNTELTPPTIIGATASGAHGNGCVGCQVDIYSDDDDEGRIYHGYATANVGGNWVYNGALTGPNVTATANDPAGNTSEFSAPFTLPATPTPSPSPTPTPTPFGQTPSPTPVPTPTPTPTPGGQTPSPTPDPTPTPTATPTPTTSPTGTGQQLTQGDVDCNGNVTSVDSLKELRHVAQLSVSQTQPCPKIGDDVASFWGDVDCNGSVTSVDALKILRYVAQLSVSQNEPCPDIGDADS